MEVTWDPAKSRSNLRKHGISFDEAATLFTSGIEYLELFDDLHSDEEDRFIAIGPISRGIVLVVHTSPEGEDLVRIISARFATKRERLLYLSTQGTQ